MKKLMLMAILFAVSQVNAQVNYLHLGNGEYKYQSLYNQSDLTFYLFGDGYHSFENNPSHQFSNNLQSMDVTVYHSEPYDHDDPDEVEIHTVTNGIGNPNIVEVPLINKVELQTSWNLVHTKENYYLLMFENTEETTISGCIEFHFDNTKSFLNEPYILDDYNNNWVSGGTRKGSEYSEYTDKYKWEFMDLEVAEQRFIYIPVSCLGLPAETVKVMAIMKKDCNEKLNISYQGDGNNPNNTEESDYFTFSSFVSTNPHDPNCIVTESECLVSDAEQRVKYRIYFQNEGVDPAIDVYLDYHINAPFSNVSLVQASHSCKLNWEPDSDGINDSGTIEIDFELIFLPGIGADPAPRYEETVGWVDIEVCYVNYALNASLLCADNSVDIIFDNEDPVTAYHSLCNKPGCTGAQGNSGTVGGREDVCNKDVEPRQIFIADSHIPPNPLMQPNSDPERIGKGGVNKTVQIIQESQNEIDKREVLVYPNPALNLLNIEIPKSLDGANLRIYNSIGEVVFSHTLKNKKLETDISHLNNGVYYISIVTESETCISSFVKI